MACFLVSVAEAAVVKVAETVEEKKEIKLGAHEGESAHANKIPLSRKLKWLFNLLIGGSVLLMFEHIWHGEITAWFPFLTAMSDPADTAEMLHEMATVGVSMAVLMTVIWAGICICADAIVKRSASDEASHEA